MKQSRTRWLTLFGFVVALAQCTSGGDSSDGKSSWLEECKADADCKGDTSCHCGVCTRGCTTASECGGLSSSTCVQAAESSATQCRVGVFARSGVCLPSCTDDGECPGPSGTMRCESGICIPVRAVVGNDAGVLPPAPEADAASGGTAGTGGAATGGLTTGGVAIASGGGNAYGGPAEFTDGFAATCAATQIVTETSGCASFNVCKHPCEHDRECPGVAGGSARPICGFGGYCELLCEDGRTCPTGMTCVQTAAARSCMWQTRQAGCDQGLDPCLRRPRPASCPEVCAEEAVACDEALGVRCCEGLACGPQHFCVAGGN